MTKYLKTKPGSIEEIAAKMASQVSESEYQQQFKKELEKAGKNIGAMTPAEKKAFFNKIDSKYKAKDEEVKEAVDNPYAVGMAQAMKSTGDKPPLKKATITKAHDIAKSIEKDQKEQASEKEIDVFHKKLDKLVHKSFGHSSDEKMKKEDKDIDELTAAQKKLPPALQKAIKDKEDKKEEVEEMKEARWEIEGRVSYKGISADDSFHMVIDAPNEKAAEDKAYDELEKARTQRKIGPRGGGGIDDAEVEYIEKTNDKLQAPTADFMGNSYDPTQKKEVEETHSFVTNKQNQKQKDAKGEKDVVDPEPKIKKANMNEQTSKQHSIMRAVYDVWSKSASELEEVKKNAKYMKAEAEPKSEQDDKEKSLKIKLDKEKDQDALEKQLISAQGQINILKQKLENEKNKAVKPQPNPETGEVPLTVGVAYKIMKDKMKKESDDKEQKKNKTLTDKPKTPVDTTPNVDYKH